MLVAASLIAAFNILLGIASFLTKQKRKNWEQENVVYLPFYIAGVGIVCGTILSIPTVVCGILEEELCITSHYKTLQKCFSDMSLNP